MSTLRRRLLGDHSSSPSRTPSPVPDPSDTPTDTVSVSTQKAQQINKQLSRTTGRPASRKRRNLWIFGLGGLFGVLVALFFVAGNNEIIDTYLKQFNLDTLIEVLPAGLVRDAQELQVSPEMPSSSLVAFRLTYPFREQTMSLLAQMEGLHAGFPTET